MDIESKVGGPMGLLRRSSDHAGLGWLGQPTRVLTVLALASILSLLAVGCSLGDDEDADGGASSTLVGSEPVSASGDGAAADGADGSESALLPGRTDGAPVLATEVGTILGETGEALDGPELEAYLAARFKAYWLAFDTARTVPTDQPDIDYPELANLAAGELLDTSFDQIRELAGAGQAISDPDAAAVPGLTNDQIHRVRISEIDGGVALLESCVVNDQVRYEIDGGVIVNDAVITVRAESTMAKADGTWKIIRSDAVAIDDGVSGCWSDGDYQY